MTPLPPPHILALPAAALGLVFGSFVTALSYRQPRAQSVAQGRSRCPACGHTLRAADLVPVFSWLASKGACRYCAAPISARYPAIECTTMALFVAAVFIESDPARLCLLVITTVVMMTLAVIDLEQSRLPNPLLAAMFALALAWRWRTDGEIAQGLIAAAIILVIGVLINACFRAATGRQGLGLGDAKLVAAAAAALPPGPLLLFLTVAGTVGVAFGAVWQWRSGKPGFPFGPPILTAYWLSLGLGRWAFDALVRGLR